MARVMVPCFRGFTQFVIWPSSNLVSNMILDYEYELLSQTSMNENEKNQRFLSFLFQSK